MREKMLIIEDVRMNRKILREIFIKEFDIMEVESAEQAIELLYEQKMDVQMILLDLVLPGMSGFEFLEKRRENAEFMEIPVVIITSSNQVSDQVRGFELGAQDFIVKPFVPEIVAARVRNVKYCKQQIEQVSKEVENLKLKTATDEMTGLQNKNSAEMSIDQELMHSHGQLHVLLVIDIDHFKTVNDTLGHQAGDKIIRIMSNIISGILRKSDIVGRIGGDEFCALMKDVPNMDIVYTKMRELFQMMKYKPNLPIPEYINLSIGIASNERKDISYSELFSKADEALYQAKQGGRGRFREYGKEIEAVEELTLNPQNQDKKPSDLIIVVDDDRITREMFSRILEDSYEVLEAENGMVAMKLIRENEDRVMMVILDLIMPIMNGYQVIEQMKRNNNLKNIPVIISTADDSEESDIRTLNLGANLIIHKPINTILLLKQVENQINAYRERKKEMKEYLLQKTLIGNRVNTFLCTYHYKTHKVEIGENYLKYVSDNFPDLFAKYPFQFEQFILPADYERVKDFFDLDNNKKVHEEIEVRFYVGDRQYEWFEINKMVNYDEFGEIESAIFMFLNIEYAVEAKQNLVFMAANDHLTHIPNMRSFTEKVTSLFQEYPEEHFQMITMDIFQFRVVNRLFGHKEGDNIIKYVATKLQEVVEEFQVGAYGRASSDIFYACISETQNIACFMQSLQQAMYNYPLKFQMKLCFGIYKIADREESIEGMIEHSAYALKMAKEAPIKTFQYYDGALKKKETFETVAISEMEEALKSSQFEVYYQPKCDIRTGEIIGAEALIRWNHPEEGYLSPAYFIPIFEKNGTCIELDYFVYEDVCRTIRRRIDQGETVVPISVNISRWSLYNEDLEKNILQIVERYQIPHEYIQFEITESAFVLETGLMTGFSESMREKGFYILIDDFGSGYSSLNSLKDISVDVLKIDIKFLPESRDEEKAEIVLSSVIKMGQKLGLEVIAEGVENEEQVELLDSLGCRYAQGYYYYKPMPCSDFEKLL